MVSQVGAGACPDMETGPIAEQEERGDSMGAGPDIDEVDDLNTRVAPLTLIVTPLRLIVALIATLLPIVTIAPAPRGGRRSPPGITPLDHYPDGLPRPTETMAATRLCGGRGGHQRVEPPRMSGRRVIESRRGAW